MRRRATVLLVHGGPGSYDHSYLTPHFGRLTAQAQVVYLDLRGHGRSARTPVADWTFEACADDLRAFCDTLGIADPVVLGHSFGGCVALLYAARHPDHPAGLVLQSTMARFDLDRLVAGFARAAGAEVAALAGREYGGDPVTDEEWSRVFAAFGPRLPDGDELARRIRNAELSEHGMRLLRRFDAVDQLARITCPALVCVGRQDPVTPVEAAREIADHLDPAPTPGRGVARPTARPWPRRPARPAAPADRSALAAATRSARSAVALARAAAARARLTRASASSKTSAFAALRALRSFATPRPPLASTVAAPVRR
jgi:proline iminopeptidase